MWCSIGWPSSVIFSVASPPPPPCTTPNSFETRFRHHRHSLKYINPHMHKTFGICCRCVLLFWRTFYRLESKIVFLFFCFLFCFVFPNHLIAHYYLCDMLKNSDRCDIEKNPKFLRFISSCIENVLELSRVHTPQTKKEIGSTGIFYSKVTYSPWHL